MKPPTFRRWQSTAALVTMVLLALGLAAAEPLINVNLGPGNKVGLAAAGSGANDFWNSYYPTNEMGQLFDPGSLVPLYSADMTNTGAGLLLFNVSTNGANSVGDAMFDSWLAASGTNLYVTLTNLPHGAYDIYVYGHGDSNELNSVVQLFAAWSNYGITNTATNGDWNTNEWTEGAQYVVFRDVLIPNGQNVQLTVGTNSAGLAILNGIQLVSKTIPETQDTDGDGLTDADELQRGTNPFAVDTDGDGLSDEAEVNMHGTDPLKADTDGDGLPDGWELLWGFDPLTASWQTLFNINFGAGNKQGKGAVGLTTNDFWNHYNPTNNDGSLFDNGVHVPLYSLSNTNLGAGLLVFNVQARGINAIGDAMFDSYLAATNGTNLVITLTNVPPGFYNILVYGHGETDQLNSTFELNSSWTSAYGSKATTTTADWNTNLWAEDAQYVIFREVAVPKGCPVIITVPTNANGLAIINGLQFIGKGVPATQNTDSDGVPDLFELEKGSNPLVADLAVSYSIPQNVPLNIVTPGLLAADPRYLENTNLTATLVTGVKHGTLTLGQAGAFTYQPATNFAGLDAFTFTVTDGTNASQVRLVLVNVLGGNSAPSAEPGELTLNEDTPTTLALTVSDPEGNVLYPMVVSNPTNGTIAISGTNLVYRPNTNYFGTDYFTYRVTDGAATSAVAGITLTINPVNDAPVSVSLNLTNLEDIVIPITLAGTDADGDALTSSITVWPTNGTLTATATNYLYRPNTNFNGMDSFRYVVNDGMLDSEEATVTITVLPVNDPPHAPAFTLNATEDILLSFGFPASDVELSPVTVEILQAPTNGVLTLDGTNATYLANTNYFGPDAFTYRAHDGITNSATVVVTISVASVNDLPVATNVSAELAEDSLLTLPIPAVDVESVQMQFRITRLPTNGIVTGQLPSNGSLYTNTYANGPFLLGPIGYRPATNYFGADSFDLYVWDWDTGYSSNVTVTVNVLAVNDAPTALLSTNRIVLAEDAPLVSLENFLTKIIVGPVNEGTQSVASIEVGVTNLSFFSVQPYLVTNVVVTSTYTPFPPTTTYTTNTNATLTFQLATNVFGTNHITIRVRDSGGTNNGGNDLSQAFQVAIEVAPVNDAPVAVSGTVNAVEDTPIAITPAASDVDSPELLYVVTSQPSHGSLSGTPPLLTYTPASNYFGSDQFTFYVSDGTLSSSAATITIEVAPVNDPPVAANQRYSVLPEMVTALTLSATDVDSTNLTFLVLTEPQFGTLSGTPPSLDYTRGTNDTATDSFTYAVTDGIATSAVATVSLLVNQKPNLAWLYPTNGASLAAGKAVALRVNASDNDGWIVSVAYSNATSLIGTSTNPPTYLVQIPPLAVGTYTLTAQAVDDLAGTKQVQVTFTVDPDTDGDGVSDAQEIADGTDPYDYYNGLGANLLIVEGDDQAGLPGYVANVPFKVLAIDGGGNPATNAPLTFNVETPEGSLVHPVTGLRTNTVTIRTDALGVALVTFVHPTNWGTLSLTSVKTISSGIESTVRFTSYTYGLNAGSLGASTPDSYTAPTTVNGVTNVILVSSSTADHVLALKADGTVWAWGSNDYGEVGDGTLIDRTNAVPVTGLSNVVDVLAVMNWSLALKSDGTVWGWGLSGAGSSTLNSKVTTPTQVPVSGIAKIGGSYASGWLLAGDGTLYTGGWNVWGEVGRGNYEPHAYWAPLSTINNIVAAASGPHHMSALRADGTVYGWGQQTRVNTNAPAIIGNIGMTYLDLMAGNPCSSQFITSGNNGLLFGTDGYMEWLSPLTFIVSGKDEIYTPLYP